MQMINSLAKNQQGVALIQVLLVSTIITILAISFTYTAREQINTAMAFEQRIKASQLLRTTQSKILFSLLTQSNFSQANELFPLSEPWNFYGKPFTLSQSGQSTIKVILQNNAGLLPQQYIDWPMWRIVLNNLNYTETQVQQLLGEIRDWQDRETDSWVVGNSEATIEEDGYENRNLPIQLPQEIDRFFKDKPENLTIIKKISMHYPMAGLNLMHAPDQLLYLYFTPSEAAELIGKREENQLIKKDVMNLLGDNYNEEYFSFFPASQFTLTIQVSLHDSSFQETIEFTTQARSNPPFLLFNRY